MNKIDHAIGILGLVLLGFAAFLGGCDPSVTQGPPLETECKFDQPVALNVVVYPTEDALRKYWNSLHPGQELPAGATVKGLATYNTRTKIHTLHVMPIRGQNDHDRIETLGHEMMHSFCGDWHPRNKY